jgi:hypothetical protein
MSALEKASAAWGEPLPREVAALAEAVDNSTGRAVAERIGYSPAVVSHILAKRYPGDVAKVFENIRGALIGETVTCPVAGEITLDRCNKEQGTPFSSSSPTRIAFWRACRATGRHACPHSKVKP